MRKELLLCGGALIVASACGKEDARVPLAASNDDGQMYATYVARVDSALGRFNDIVVFTQDSGTKAWHLATGQYAPVTVDNKTPTHYVKDMASDRPMMLPTRVQNFQGGDGQSSPYSAIGRMPGSNPEVQWIWVVRQYSIKDTTQPDFPNSGDMAVIGHHPRTGATTFLQFYDPAHPKSGRVVVSPFSADGQSFWSPIKIQADSFQCQRCHAAGPFIHSPWVNQVTVGNRPPGSAAAEPIVPSDPLGPYFFIDAAEGQLFWKWDAALIASKGGGHLNKPANVCTQCHRVAPSMIGLNQNSTRYAGLTTKGDSNSWSIRSDSSQTLQYRALHWMPVLATPQIDFYAGQKTFGETNWNDAYLASATEMNRLESDSLKWKAAYAQGIVADVPRPPRQYQTIVVDRPEADQVTATNSLWIVDSRMRANTDGALEQWRFFAKAAASTQGQAAPVVYRRKPGSGLTIQYDVVFVGQAQGPASTGQWNPVQPAQTFQVKQGDTFGVVFTTTGTAAGAAIIPYTKDDWARLKRPDGTTWLRDGSVTYQVMTGGTPKVGTTLSFSGADFRTYSFEFRNKI